MGAAKDKGPRLPSPTDFLRLKGNLHATWSDVGYWGLGLTSEQQLELVQEAESLGYDSVWAAEAYGSDTATVLAWLAGADGEDQDRLGDLPDARRARPR